MRKGFLRNEDGQMMLWLSLALVMLILFTGIAVDMGVIYMTKARLSNSVDSAVLMAAKNFNLGQAAAQDLGDHMFWANFGSTTPSRVWTWCPGPAVGCGSAVAAGLKATTTINTVFLGYLPALRVWSIGANAQATRSTLIMTLILDRSGSMQSDGGGTALQSAVPQFISDFIPGTDFMSMISFASHSSIDVPMTQAWGAPTNQINNAVSAFNFEGATFGTGAGSGSVDSTTNGPPLNMADTQNNSVVLPPTQPVTKVAIYFTDGLMNSLQDYFSCPQQVLLNYGGVDKSQCGRGDPCEIVYTLDPLNEDNGNPWYCYDPSGNDCTNSQGLAYDSRGDLCKNAGHNVTTFPSQEFGPNQPITRANVTEEAQYRAKYTANVMRTETPNPTYIYVIGLGSGVTGDQCTEAFLASMANDPTGSQYSCPAHPATFFSSQPQGLFLAVPSCPGAYCTAQLTQAFQTIAAKVLLRLSQ